MLRFPVLQTKTRFNTGDEVYRITVRGTGGVVVGDRFWICCIQVRADGVYYRLKKSRYGDLGDFVEESELQAINYA